MKNLSYNFPQIIENDNLQKNIFEIKFAYVTNDTAKTGIKNHSYHYITSHETVICDKRWHDWRTHITLIRAI
jgi:hypothetical protein